MPEQLPPARFCQCCGGYLVERYLPLEGRPRLLCELCGYVHYLNPRVVAAAIVERDGRILLQQRAVDPRAGFWTFPGGFVEMGETPEQCAVRETREEAGIDVALAGLHGVYARPDVGIVVVVYQATSPSGTAVAADRESQAVRWFTPDAIPWDALAFDTTAAALHDWAANRAGTGPAVEAGASSHIERLRAVDPMVPPYAWHDDLRGSLPARFQKYAAELLFDDERVIFFLHRPAFARRRHLLPIGRRENEGLLLLTDRMVLFMQDAIPPGPMFVDWGYDARLAPSERIVAASVRREGATSTLTIEVAAEHGSESLAWTFPAEAQRALGEAASILRAYADRAPMSLRRRYEAPLPAWEPPDARAARRRIAGRPLSQPEEDELPVATAASGHGTIALSDDGLRIEAASGTTRVAVSEVASLGIWRAVTGCALDVYVPEGASTKRWSVGFQYPQSSPFLRVAARLRHLMARTG